MNPCLWCVVVKVSLMFVSAVLFGIGILTSLFSFAWQMRVPHGYQDGILAILEVVLQSIAQFGSSYGLLSAVGGLLAVFALANLNCGVSR